MDTNSQVVVSETAQLPLEVSSPPREAFTDVIYLDLGDTTAHSGALVSYVEDFLDGCGQVNMLSLSVKYQFSTETDYIRVGTAAMASSATTAQLSRKKNGLTHTGNAFTKGTTFIVDIIPMSNISRRLQPPSPNEPMLKLAYEKSATCVVSFIFHLQVVGIREHHNIIGSASAAAEDEE